MNEYTFNQFLEELLDEDVAGSFVEELVEVCFLVMDEDHAEFKINLVILIFKRRRAGLWHPGRGRRPQGVGRSS